MKTIEITPEIAQKMAKGEFEKFFYISNKISLEEKREAVEGCLIRMFKKFLGEQLKDEPVDMDKKYSKGYKEIEYFSINLSCPVDIDIIISYLNQFFQFEEFKHDSVCIEAHLRSGVFIVISKYPNRILFTASVLL